MESVISESWGTDEDGGEGAGLETSVAERRRIPCCLSL